MNSIKITVLETFDPQFCCVCTGAGIFNIFENGIKYSSEYISLQFIIKETLAINVS